MPHLFYRLDDTTACIKLAFPEVSAQIIEVRYSIAADLFYPAHNKDNIITYMPRKLPHHSSNVVSFLRLQHLDNWTIMPIDKMTESEVAATLRRSKIFLAFSELEGFGLPPVEAAL